MARGTLTTSNPPSLRARGTLTTSNPPALGARGTLTTSNPPPRAAPRQLDSRLPPLGKGWNPDLPDIRDFDEDSKGIKEHLIKIGVHGKPKTNLPAEIDLKHWCSPIEHQGGLSSCTAHAAVGLMEYLMRRANGDHIDGSRLFVYKTSLNILKWKNDDGAYLRTAIGVLALFGMPPEEYWPYDEDNFNEEPTPFCYGFANAFKASKYYRLDGVGVTKDALLNKIKAHLAAGLPSIFGFTTFNSMDHKDNKPGDIPFPDKKERSSDGHAVMAVGYDDKRKIKNPLNGKSTTGALLIRNSWGTEWGEGGYGWLPYEYVLQELAMDWWCVIKEDWVNTNQFGYSAK